MKRIVMRAISLSLCLIILSVGGALAQSAPTRTEAQCEALIELLYDLVIAYEAPSDADGARIDADLELISQFCDAADATAAASIADHWRRVYLNPDHRLYLWPDKEDWDAFKACGIENSRSHAFVVLGYQLENGEMTHELKGRCETAAAAALAFPNAILICSGGATGENNPDGHTEAGLMRDYLVNVCGVDPSRIFTDERAMTTAENAINTFAIMQEQGVSTMTIITSVYHQRWGEALYNALATIYAQESGYKASIVGNYCYNIEPSVEAYHHDDRIAALQLGQILGLSQEELSGLRAAMKQLQD